MVFKGIKWGNFDRNILIRISRYHITYHYRTIKFPFKSSMSEIKILPNIPIANGMLQSMESENWKVGQ